MWFDFENTTILSYVGSHTQDILMMVVGGRGVATNLLDNNGLVDIHEFNNVFARVLDLERNIMNMIADFQIQNTYFLKFFMKYASSSLNGVGSNGVAYVASCPHT